MTCLSINFILSSVSVSTRAFEPALRTSVNKKWGSAGGGMSGRSPQILKKDAMKHSEIHNLNVNILYSNVNESAGGKLRQLYD